MARMLDRWLPIAFRPRAAVWLLAGVADVLGPVGAGRADDTAPPPASFALRYQGLNHRQDFRFRMPGHDAVTRPVGDLTFEFPPDVFPTAGLEPTVRAFCVEPLIPITAGSVYPFQVHTLNQPRWYGLPESDDGQKLADQRLAYIRELYGRFYKDVQLDSAAAAPAFQVALWEVIAEAELPDGPMPFNLFTGSFQALYPNEAEAPPFVRQAQQYVQALTADATVFTTNPGLGGLEPIRMTAVNPPDGDPHQSQVILRSVPIRVSGGLGGQPGGGPGQGGIGGPGGLGPLGGLGGAPFLGGGGGGPVVGSPLGPGGTGALTPIPNTPGTDPEGTDPLIPNADRGTSDRSPSVREPVDVIPLSPPPVTDPPQSPPPPPAPPPPVVPAPPGVVLGGLAVGLWVIRRVRRGSRE